MKNSKKYQKLHIPSNVLYTLLAVVLMISNILISFFAAAEIEKYVPQWTQPIIGFGMVLIITLNAIGWFRHYR